MVITPAICPAGEEVFVAPLVQLSMVKVAKIIAAEALVGFLQEVVLVVVPALVVLQEVVLVGVPALVVLQEVSILVIILLAVGSAKM